MTEETNSLQPEEENEEDDPIVKEIPVFLSKRLQENLYVFQYPLQPKMSKTQNKIRKVFVKPESQEVKLEMELNTKSSNFNVLKAEEIARDVNTKKKNSECNGSDEKCDGDNIVYENDIMDNITLTSTKAVKDPRKYAVGCYTGKELHLTSLKGFLQLRPSLPPQQNITREPNTNAAGDSDEEDKESEVLSNKVTVKFANKKKETSINKRTTEPWLECMWHENKSPLSESQKQYLLAETNNDTHQEINMKADEYIRKLIPEDPGEAYMKSVMSLDVAPLHVLQALPLKEQLTKLLKRSKILHFTQLLSIISEEKYVNPESVLQILPQVAVLVCGNWVVKSELLYPEYTFSDIHAVPAEVMCFARDYILFLFNKNQCVNRKRVACSTKIHIDEITEILTGISKLNSDNLWELSMPKDTDFISQLPKLAERNRLFWRQRATEVINFLKSRNQIQVSSSKSGSCRLKKK